MLLSRVILLLSKLGSCRADSYKRWVLKDYMALLRLRSLLARKRARTGPGTPEAVARLFDGVPDPCFWKVVEYAWLGNWRRP